MLAIDFKGKTYNEHKIESVDNKWLTVKVRW